MNKYEIIIKLFCYVLFGHFALNLWLFLSPLKLKKTLLPLATINNNLPVTEIKFASGTQKSSNSFLKHDGKSVFLSFRWVKKAQPYLGEYRKGSLYRQTKFINGIFQHLPKINFIDRQ